jgi:hypothetical protein
VYWDDVSVFFQAFAQILRVSWKVPNYIIVSDSVWYNIETWEGVNAEVL